MIVGISNLDGGFFVCSFMLIIKGGKCSLGLIFRGKCFEGIYILKCKKLFETCVQAKA